jgi:hypothetical protein
LRVDRQMSWMDIARVMEGDGADDPSRHAATLRKRFERLKDRLRSMAHADAGGPADAHAH